MTLVPVTLASIGQIAEWGRRFVPVPRERRVRVLDALALGPGNRLAVVAFGDRELLLSITKTSVVLLAEQEA